MISWRPDPRVSLGRFSGNGSGLVYVNARSLPLSMTITPAVAVVVVRGGCPFISPVGTAMGGKTLEAVVAPHPRALTARR
jgi:hypothetical protein